ncbi:MAG: Spy/CpxP family protein refolding chaperone [Edaphobacter sp.]|uniref:Spy/CpxP family protein refolding chaperone n=1 Tax=Edaphobacter sp. TaxID=1934404 RepID=UPI0023A6D052|nr:Spy/CpxP family protein refolding chaperone [Edaphobacter sp.]MDE1177843.1 Spy/CpxP family protein refolding chaperone [Edaphobacter sp.]
MNNRRILVAFSIAALCGTSALAQQNRNADHPRVERAEFHGDPGPGGPGGPGFGGPHGIPSMLPPGMWWKNPDLIQKLNLTDDQRKRMDDIFQQARMQLIDLKANVEKQELLLEPMLADNPPDTNKVLSQIDHVASARAELEKSLARMLLGIRGVLTADQWTKLQAERPKFHGRDGRDGHGDFGPGGAHSNGFKGPGGPGAPLS